MLENAAESTVHLMTEAYFRFIRIGVLFFPHLLSDIMKALL